MTKDEMRFEIRQLALRAGEIDPSEIFAEKLEGCSHLIIYGAGNVGRNCINFMRKRGYAIECFLDRNADVKPEYLGYPVYKPDDIRLNKAFRKGALIVLALILSDNEYNELESQLRTLGYTKFLNAHHQLGLSLSYYDNEPNDRILFVQETENVLAAFDLMSDEHSQSVFLSVFGAHAMINYKLPVQSPDMAQYVDVYVPFKYKYRTFVDCGAYTGDTLGELIKRHRVEQYFGFEPDLDNYVKLLQTVDSICDNVGKSVLLPMGVGSRNEFLRFYSTGSSSGRIDETGDIIVQIARLDDLLKGYYDLMIKMDIEGAETAALNGAKRIITETKPDLAICVYHKVSDMWRIPLMLKDWVPEYRFYLRNHFAGTMETVLYATVI